MIAPFVLGDATSKDFSFVFLVGCLDGFLSVCVFFLCWQVMYFLCAICIVDALPPCHMYTYSRLWLHGPFSVSDALYLVGDKFIKIFALFFRRTLFFFFFTNGRKTSVGRKMMLFRPAVPGRRENEGKKKRRGACSPSLELWCWMVPGLMWRPPGRILPPFANVLALCRRVDTPVCSQNNSENNPKIRLRHDILNEVMYRYDFGFFFFIFFNVFPPWAFP